MESLLSHLLNRSSFGRSSFVLNSAVVSEVLPPLCGLLGIVCALAEVHWILFEPIRTLKVAKLCFSPRLH